MVKLLVGMDGINPNLKDNYGRTALLWAAKNENVAVVKLLVGMDGINPNLKDNYGQTALLWAIKKQERRGGGAAARGGWH